MEYRAFYRIEDLNIRVYSAGSGPPVMLVHGFTGTADDWRSNIPELSKRFSVYAVDLPGFGFSDKPLNFDYTSRGYAKFILNFLDAFHLDRAFLIGNSMGGQIALMTCLKYPKRIGGLVLIDSGGYPGSVEFLPFKLLKIPIIGEISMAIINRTIIGIMLKKGVYFNSSLATKEVIDNYYQVYRMTNARKIPPIVIRNITKDEQYIASNLGDINCPTLVLWGAEDRIISPNKAEMFKRDISGASSLMVPKAGHLPQGEKPKIVNKAIIDFLSGVI